MKRLCSYLPLLVLLLMLAAGVTSCREATHRRDVRAALQHAEALMETDPHAARAVLDSLNLQSSIFNLPSKDVALYALLRTQADYKCRVRLTSDSLPLIATDYYGTRRKTQRAALAQYYLGCTYSDMDRDLDAIDALLRATTLFPDTTNKYYVYCQRDLGKKLLDHEQQAKALEAFRHYRWSDICRFDSVNLGWADWSMGMAYLFLEQAELAEPYFLEVIANPSVNKRLHDNTCFQLAKLYAFLKEDYHKAQPYINQTIASYSQKEEIGAAYFLKGEVCYHTGERDSAYYYYNKVLECEKDIRTYCETYKRLLEVSQSLGRTDSMGVWFEHYVALSDSVNQIRRDKEISDIENNHIVELHDRELAAHRSRLHWTWGILSALFFIVTGIILLLNDRRHKVKELQYEQKLKAIEKQYIQDNLKEETEEKHDPTDELIVPSATSDSHPDVPYFALQQQRLTLYRSQFKTSKWPHYFILHGDDIKSEQFMPINEAEAFLQYINELFVNMTVDLLRENTNMKRDDIDFCCMTLLGFATKQIAYCCRKPTKYCYNRRTRLSERLTPEWYQFIFGKQPKQA